MEYRKNRKSFLIICSILIIISVFDIKILRVSASFLILRDGGIFDLHTIAIFLLVILYIYFFIAIYQSVTNEILEKKHSLKKNINNIFLSVYRVKLNHFVSSSMEHRRNSFKEFFKDEELHNKHNIYTDSFTMFSIFPKAFITYKISEKQRTELKWDKDYCLIMPNFNPDSPLFTSFHYKLFSRKYRMYLFIIWKHISFISKESYFSYYIFPFLYGVLTPFDTEI